MTLWIRTQDKGKLIQINGVELIEDDTPNDVLYLIYDIGGLARLGEYKTEERALEVLDEIQKKITEASVLWIEQKPSPFMIKEKYKKELQDSVKKGIPILSDYFEIKSTNIDTIVYEMPEE